MSLHSDQYFELMDKYLGGVNKDSLDSFFYWNNPFALKHWTMNVVEILMIAGAIAAFVHAWRVAKYARDPSNLCLCLSAIIYLLVVEVPLYFPQLVGADPTLVFIHNEFTAGMLFNQTPFYIVALYPALLYPSYVLVQQAGIFERRRGVWLGAVCVGFIHSCFYEIFDHYGPQFGWWVWNFDHPHVHLRLASVPLTSMIVFSLTPPMVATLLLRAVISNYVRNKRRAGQPLAGFSLACRTLLVGVLIPVVNGVLPTSLLTVLLVDESVVRPVYYGVMALCALAAVWIFVQQKSSGPIDNGGNSALHTAYPRVFFSIYLLTFALLWLYALKEYWHAVDGLTARGTPVGSLAYVLFCALMCVFFVYRSRMLRRTRAL